MKHTAAAKRLCAASRLLGAVAALLAAASPPARAQQTPQTPQDTTPSVQQAGTETRRERSVSMSEGVYRRLTAVHELLGDGRLDEALQHLDQLAQARLSPYEEALVQQAFGFCYAQQGHYQEAIRAFERSLALDALPNDAQQGMLYSLAGLYASEGQFEKTVATMRTWFKYAEEPVPADAYMLVASSYAQLEKLQEALPYAREAIKRASTPNESWYMLELSIDFELKDYKSASALLRDMVLYWPDNGRYWEMLASAYLELEDDRNALATLMIAYRKGLVDDEAQLLNLVRLNMFLEIPYEAGRILETAMAANRVETNQKNLELLLSAWTAAREVDKALVAIDRLAPLADDGEYYVQKAQLLAERTEWRRAVDAADQAIEKGGLKDPATVYLLKGMAYAELGEYDDALAVFAEARRFGGAQGRNVDAWIGYVKDRQQVAQAGP
jgi:tetratricopeptide (TPR) repeat protein